MTLVIIDILWRTIFKYYVCQLISLLQYPLLISKRIGNAYAHNYIALKSILVNKLKNKSKTLNTSKSTLKWRIRRLRGTLCLCFFFYLKLFLLACIHLSLIVRIFCDYNTKHGFSSKYHHPSFSLLPPKDRRNHREYILMRFTSISTVIEFESISWITPNMLASLRNSKAWGNSRAIIEVSAFRGSNK